MFNRHTEVAHMYKAPIHETFSPSQTVYEMGRYYPGFAEARRLVISPFLQAMQTSEPELAELIKKDDNVPLYQRLDDYFSSEILEGLFECISSNKEIYDKDSKDMDRLKNQFSDWQEYLKYFKHTPEDLLPQRNTPQFSETIISIEKARHLGMGITFMGGLSNYRKLFQQMNPNFVGFDKLENNDFIHALLIPDIRGGEELSHTTMRAGSIALNNIKRGRTIFYHQNPVDF